MFDPIHKVDNSERRRFEARQNLQCLEDSRVFDAAQGFGGCDTSVVPVKSHCRQHKLTQQCCGSPKQPSAAVFVGAEEDAYVAKESIQELAAHWPGSEVRWVPGGHVSAFLLQQHAFRIAISDSLSRLRV